MMTYFQDLKYIYIFLMFPCMWFLKLKTNKNILILQIHDIRKEKKKINYLPSSAIIYVYNFVILKNFPYEKKIPRISVKNINGAWT